jgi:hypothetical protein
MAETFDQHKTDSQKTWRRRDRKLRPAIEGRNFRPSGRSLPDPASLPNLASPVFEGLALAELAAKPSRSRRFSKSSR